jgi:hypothetical protein
MLPESWLLPKFSCLQDTQYNTQAAIASRQHSHQVLVTTAKQLQNIEQIARGVAPTPLHTPSITEHAPHSTALREHHNVTTEPHTQPHMRLLCHTHVRAIRLPSIDGMLPESLLLPKYKNLQDTRAAIASHHGTRRCGHTQSAVRNASQLIA